MIIPMTRARLLGPRERLDEVLDAVQDSGLVHLAEPVPVGGLRPLEMSPQEERESRHLQDLVRDLESVTNLLPSARTSPAGSPAFAAWARQARRLRRDVDRLDARSREIEEERSQLARFEQFIQAFRGLLPAGNGARTHSYHLVLRGEDEEAISRLRDGLAKVIGDQFMLETASLPTGERAAALVVHTPDAPRVERLLAQAGIHELPMPARYAGQTLGQVAPELAERRKGLDRELEDLAVRRREIVSAAAPELARARPAVEDRLLALAARERAATTARSFVLEGWVPTAGFGRLSRQLRDRFGESLVIEAVAQEEWQGANAPVVLTNPRLFRPFEAVTRMMPLPAYGSIDPTPFVAVFFPMFFGLILCDFGYGAVLAVLALWLRRRGAPGSTLRAVAEILGACAAFTVAFGVAFGECFGDLGRRALGIRPLLLDREESLMPFLGLAVAIGVVHISLGLVLGIVNTARGHPRQAVGRGAALAMLAFIVVALLAAFDVLPGGFFTPAVIALLLAFPVLVIAEGIIAPIEFLSTLSNVLSYARIMALGTASVMMAMVANRLAGSVGSVIVGVLFGLLFHLVNFALGIFAPTIHGLRLHYVEFFGKFYSPGGQEYRPFSHWRHTGIKAA
jgi:V/A-type H+/Na+-transporting ATPase subunit I